MTKKTIVLKRGNIGVCVGLFSYWPKRQREEQRIHKYHYNLLQGQMLYFILQPNTDLFVGERKQEITSMK